MNWCTVAALAAVLFVHPCAAVGECVGQFFWNKNAYEMSLLRKCAVRVHE